MRPAMAGRYLTPRDFVNRSGPVKNLLVQMSRESVRGEPLSPVHTFLGRFSPGSALAKTG
jgi:hypothetical protein